MRIRSEWIWIPLTCVLVAWVVRTAQPSCRFTDVVEALHVSNEAEYRKLAVLGLAIVGGMAALRVLRNHRKDD